MKTIMGILITFLLINLSYPVNINAQFRWPPAQPSQPGQQPNPAPAPSNPDKPGQGYKPGTDTAKDLEINWQGETITAALKVAAKEKKIAFIYFYFNPEKEQFPPNYDPKLQKYSTDKFIFAKVHAKLYADKLGKLYLADPANAAFFEKNKLPLNAVAVAVDFYGNMLDSLRPPMTASKIISFLDAAEKKFTGNINDLNKRYSKADELLVDIDSPLIRDKDKKIQEAIKILTELTKSNLEGYEAIKKANDKLEELNNRAFKEYVEILKDYADWENGVQNPKAIMPELEKIMRTYKGLPVEQGIKEDIKSLEAGNIPEWILKEIEKEKQKLAEQKPQKE